MGTLTTTTAPIEEPVEVSEVMTAIRATNTDDTDRLTNIITAARIFAEQYTNTRIMTQTVKLNMDRWPASEFLLGVWPLQAIVSVKYYNTASPSVLTTLAANTDYYADITTMGGRVRTISGWPSIAVQPNAISITMTAGYATKAEVPEAIKEGIKAYCVYLYDGDYSMLSVAKDILWPQRIL